MLFMNASTKNPQMEYCRCPKYAMSMTKKCPRVKFYLWKYATTK